MLPLLDRAPFERPDEEISRLRRATGTRYRVFHKIGAGGMASVYGAEQTVLARQVVIKVLHPHLARDTEVAERFRREAEAAARLVHPHICPILDYGSANGVVFTVLPYLEGGSLADVIQNDRTVDPTRAAAVAAQVACALDYAHRRGVFHRDIKPDNVLFDTDGNAIVTDFGIATARFHGRLTASGRAMGTPHYMSPEQAMGKLVDGRSDIYAIGILLYESLLGFPPFDGADAFSVSYKQVHEAAVPPIEVSSRVPPALSDIVMRCLAKSASSRYQRGYDLADVLLDYLGATDAGGPFVRAATTARWSGAHSS
ncbi:MAG TPA: serine/threonine-protein kinase [Gemmatimonadaceae bacterium]|jgi:serine/threonine-protein kinase|nr:serine/threonine-protein kinase [Gemmatimonadaceae bacterium]